MFVLIVLSILQAAFIAAGQVLMKIALEHTGHPAFTSEFIMQSLILNWWWALCGVAFIIAGVMWMYLLKHFPFSIVYPLSSIAYIFGMIAACLIFKEPVQLVQWAGILLIMAGCALVVK